MTEKKKKGLTLFNLPWPIFLIIAVIVYLVVLPKGMTRAASSS